ncbi:hypothetical protein MPER_16063 [Moniliophthora perniciosa FA553]|nr:hypothetical protein MPER_16063 [Moniliophthora perniciosa FA553]
MDPSIGILYDKAREEAELRGMNIASSVDAHTASLRAHEAEINALKKGIEDVKVMNAEMRSIKDALASMPGQIATALSSQTSAGSQTDNNGGVRGKHGQPMMGGGTRYACFFCGEEGHRVRDCPYQREMINKGWVAWNTQTNRYMLKDGSSFPSTKPGEKLKDKVADIVKAKGWDRAANPDAYLYMAPEEEVMPVYQATTIPPETGVDWSKFAD